MSKGKLTVNNYCQIISNEGYGDEVYKVFEEDSGELISLIDAENKWQGIYRREELRKVDPDNVKTKTIWILK